MFSGSAIIVPVRTINILLQFIPGRCYIARGWSASSRMQRVYRCSDDYRTHAFVDEAATFGHNISTRLYSDINISSALQITQCVGIDDKL